MRNIKRKRLTIRPNPNGMKYEQERKDSIVIGSLRYARSVNLLLNNRKVIRWNSKSMMKIPAKMISLEGNSIPLVRKIHSRILLQSTISNQYLSGQRSSGDSNDEVFNLNQPTFLLLVVNIKRCEERFFERLFAIF